MLSPGFLQSDSIFQARQQRSRWEVALVRVERTANFHDLMISIDTQNLIVLAVSRSVSGACFWDGGHDEEQLGRIVNGHQGEVVRDRK